MLKYYKLGESYYSFPLDGSQDQYITEDMIRVSDEEIDKLLYPEKYWTDEEKEEYRLSRFPSPNRKQFKTALYDNGLIGRLLEHISSIEDERDRTLAVFEYEDSLNFVRSSKTMPDLLFGMGLTLEEVDNLWMEASKN